MDRSRATRVSGVLLLAAGTLLLAWAVAEGQASIAFLLIIPVIYGSGPLAALSVLAIIGGMMLIFLSLVPSRARESVEGPAQETNREWGGVVLIGPVPIIIGSAGMLKDRRVLMLLAIISSLVLALFLFTLLR
ncbi:MAG: DUF131 domain-containing protein [Methanomassiliicoccus sp.]|nr:DUF131 domain-containing protein [Methanomassiliicoccus sp.]